MVSPLTKRSYDKICQYKKSRSSLFILDNRKRRTSKLKDDNGKMIWVKVIFVIFFDAITTVHVLTATNNDLKT